MNDIQKLKDGKTVIVKSFREANILCTCARAKGIKTMLWKIVDEKCNYKGHGVKKCGV